MIARLAIYLLLGGCLILGAIIFVELQPTIDDEPALTGSPAKPHNAAPTVPRQPSTHLDELVTTVLARPLFSSTRRPPQSAGNEGPSSADLGDTRLTGIVTEPGHSIAIFAVNGAKPLIVTEGEAVSGWRIEAITPREVSLSGPSGTKTLEPKADPNLAPPAPTPLPNPAARPPGQPVPAAAAPRPGIPPPRPGAPAPGVPPPRPGRVGTR